MSVAKYRSGEDVYYLSNGKVVKSTIISSTIYPGDEQAVYEVAESLDGAVRKEIYEDELFLTDVSAAANYKKSLLVELNLKYLKKFLLYQFQEIFYSQDLQRFLLLNCQ